jgi:hypothetical protein
MISGALLLAGTRNALFGEMKIAGFSPRLFFGDQHQEHDFIYREELTGWHDSGLLTRLDLAFCRHLSPCVTHHHRRRNRHLPAARHKALRPVPACVNVRRITSIS